MTPDQRQAAVQQLHEAADDLADLIDQQHPDALNPDQWLRDRANAVEEG